MNIHFENVGHVTHHRHLLAQICWFCLPICHLVDVVHICNYLFLFYVLRKAIVICLILDKVVSGHLIYIKIVNSKKQKERLYIWKLLLNFIVLYLWVCSIKIGSHHYHLYHKKIFSERNYRITMSTTILQPLWICIFRICREYIMYIITLLPSILELFA